MIIWALFDSGNGCYKKAAELYFADSTEVYSVGIDIENKNDHFIHLDLGSYAELFGDMSMYECLDALPSPDVILASPPPL